MFVKVWRNIVVFVRFQMCWYITANVSLLIYAIEAEIICNLLYIVPIQIDSIDKEIHSLRCSCVHFVNFLLEQSYGHYTQFIPTSFLFSKVTALRFNTWVSSSHSFRLLCVVTRWKVASVDKTSHFSFDADESQILSLAIQTVYVSLHETLFSHSFLIKQTALTLYYLLFYLVQNWNITHAVSNTEHMDGVRICQAFFNITTAMNAVGWLFVNWAKKIPYP